MSNIVVETCAQAAHEVNRIFCEANGDHSQAVWKDAPQWQRSSAISGCAVALAGATPEQQHEAWCKTKWLDGWKYGPVKDADKKEHPCLVPYEKLSDEQKAKDGLYIAVVNAMYKALS